jgi:hypothetical protein
VTCPRRRGGAGMATGGEEEARVKSRPCGRPGWLICTRTGTRSLSVRSARAGAMNREGKLTCGTRMSEE